VSLIKTARVDELPRTEPRPKACRRHHGRVIHSGPHSFTIGDLVRPRLLVDEGGVSAYKSWPGDGRAQKMFWHPSSDAHSLIRLRTMPLR